MNRRCDFCVSIVLLQTRLTDGLVDQARCRGEREVVLRKAAVDPGAMRGLVFSAKLVARTYQAVSAATYQLSTWPGNMPRQLPRIAGRLLLVLGVHNR